MEATSSERVAKNTGFLFIRMLLILGVGLFTSREILRILGVTDFGIYNLVGTLVTMFVFFQMALNNATSRFITFDLGAGNLTNLQKTFSMSMNTELVVFGIILVLSEAVGPWFIAHKLQIPEGRMFAAQMVFQISLFNFLFGLIFIPYRSIIIAHEKMSFYSYTSIAEAIFKLLSVYFLLIISFDKLIFYALFQMGVSVVMFFWYLYYSKKHFEEARYTLYWDGKLLKKIVSYSGLSLLLNVADIAVGQSISIFFNMFQGVVANAALGVANTVNNYIGNFLNNFTTSYNPQIIKSYAAKQYDYFMKLIYSSSKMSFFLFFAVAFPIILNINEILQLWLANPPAQTGTFVVFIVAYGLFDSFSWPLMHAVHATGNLKVHQPLMASIKILNIPISYLLLKNGAPSYIILVVYAALNLVCAIVRIIYLHFLIHLDLYKYFKEVLFKMILISCISVPIPMLIAFSNDNKLMTLFSTTAVFLAIYSVCVYFLGLNKREKEIMGDMLCKAKSKIIRR